MTPSVAQMSADSSPLPFGAMFSGYHLGRAYDEMFDRSGQARGHCRALYRDLLELSLKELRERQGEADRAFLTQGITFTVYGDTQGTERIFPYDLLPRIITADEWRTLERGLAQRLTAINLFLKDVYHEGRIFSEGIVPRELVYSCRHYRREMRGVHVNRDIYVSVCGHRPGASRGRPLRGARGQPAGPERRVVHAREPRGDEARASRRSSIATRWRRSPITARRCSRRCARLRRRAGPTRPSSCSRPASATPPTSSTPFWPARWASRSSKGATSWSTTTSCTCGPPRACGAST